MEDGGTIKISFKKEDDNIILNIMDDGIGIPEKDLEKFKTKEEIIIFLRKGCYILTYTMVSIHSAFDIAFGI